MVAILGGDVTVEYLANNRLKYMYWSGGDTTRTMNELYSAMATLLDETTTIDSGTAFSAETPVEYTTGKIDSGDTEPWYITFDLMEHITGGALRTTGWLRAVGTNTGVVIVPVTAGGAIVSGDVGNDITHADLDAGTLLEVLDDGGAGDEYLVIRPDSSAAANNFDSAAGNLTCNGHVSAQTSAATSGDMIWANLYSIGTIDSNVHLYCYQGEAAADTDRNRVYSWNDGTQDWYGNGHIDMCVAIKDITVSTWSVIDNGYISVFGRKYMDLFASFEVENSTTSGGRNPIPLQTSSDLDNITGIQKVTCGAWAGGPYEDGEIITGALSGARGIVDLSESTADTHIVYTPIDDPQIDFHSSGAEAMLGASSGATSNSTALPVDHGPAAAAWFTTANKPTTAFTYVAADIDDDGTDEHYGVTIDCNANPLTEVYEWLKYSTRNGEITTDLDGINGERYIGAEVYLKFTNAPGGAGWAEGGDVTQAVTGATGVIIAYNNVAGSRVALLRDVRGTFSTANVVTDNDTGGTVTPDLAAVTFAPKTASPLGTFAGGTFFGARGVRLLDWLAADENSFQLTPMEGGTKTRPQAVSITVTNLIGTDITTSTDDRVSVFRLSGGSIKKDEYICLGGEVAGDATLTTAVAGGDIAQDVPGKTTGGSLILVDDPAGDGAEYKIRYSSYTGRIFTLANYASFVSDGVTSATIVEDIGGVGFNANVKRGDLVYNSTRALIGYVKTVDDDDTLTLEGDGIAGQVAGDNIEINCIPIVVGAADELYIPFIDCVSDATSESVSVIYLLAFDYRVIVRNTRNTTKIKPYSSDGNCAGTDQSIPCIRTEDTIIS